MSRGDVAAPESARNGGNTALNKRAAAQLAAAAASRGGKGFDSFLCCYACTKL